MRAVCRGCRHADAIAANAGIQRAQAYNHLRRLVYLGFVRRVKSNAAGHRVEYIPRDSLDTMLSKIWGR